jgi:hypothetical protein
VTYVEATFTQRFGQLWDSMQRTYVDVEKASLTSAESGDGWAAAYRDDLLIGVADSPLAGRSSRRAIIAWSMAAA